MSGFNRRIARTGSTDSYKFSKINAVDEHGRVFTLNYTNVFATVSAVLIGVFSIYTAMHYITPYFSHGNVLRTGSDEAVATVDAEFNASLTDRLLHSFKQSDVFIPKGKYVQMDYIIPRGATIDVTLTRCKSIPIIEVFNCIPASSQTETISGKMRGSARFRFGKSGFYVFQHAVNLPAVSDVAKPNDAPEKIVPPSIIWRRGN